MNDLILQKFIALLEAFRQISGLEVVWKTAVGMAVDMRLPERQRNHMHLCCVGAKEDKSGFFRCLYNDYNLISTQLRGNSVPFLHRCHAGLVELVVPLLDKNRCVGVIQCGPFLLEDDEPRAGLKVLAEKDVESLKLLIPQIFSEIVAQAYPIVPVDTYQVRDNRIWEIQEYIERNYSRPIRIDQLAHQCFLSRSRLIHLFRQQCDMSFSEYLVRVRLREAKKFLLNTDWSLGVIALRCGFSNQSHFSRSFRRRTGMTPLAYRRQHSRLRSV